MFQQSEDKPLKGIKNQELLIMGKNSTKTMIRKLKGFTLIELMVAITVIGILVGALLVVINPVEQLKKGRDGQRKHDLSQLQRALEIYYNDKGKYPPSIPSENSWPGYIETMPKDPVTGQSYQYQVSEDKSSYQLSVNLERCSDMQVTIKSGDDCIYRVTSPNLAVGGADSFPTPMPTSSPTLTQPSAAPTVTVQAPTPTPTPTPFPVKRAFVSKSWTDGRTNGVSGADAFCQQQANQNSLGGTWIAWLSDGGSGSAVSRLNPSGAQYRYMLVDMTTLVANSWADLTDGTLIHAIDKDQFGILSPGVVVWTNTGINGQKIDSGATGTCVNWGNNSSGRKGNVGHTGFTNNNWTQFTDGSQFQCDINRALYCFEK